MTLEISKVNKFLSNKYGEHINNLEPVGFGEWSQAFYFTVNGLHKVIRFNKYDNDFYCDLNASKFNSVYLPIPKIEEIGTGLDLKFAISNRIHGEMLDKIDDIKPLIPSLLEMFNALRMADTSTSSGFGGWDKNGNGVHPSWHKFLIGVNKPTDRVAGWEENLKKDNFAFDLFEKGFVKMESLIKFCPEMRALVHNDLLHFNVLVKDNRIAGVIDWGCALYGDPLYDLAMFTTWQFYYPFLAGVDFIKIYKEYFKDKNIEDVNFEERLECYQLHLLLDSVIYQSHKENKDFLNLSLNRLKELISTKQTLSK